MNTSRAANKYLQAIHGKNFAKVYTLGCIGNDEAGKQILQQLRNENLMHDIYIDDQTLTGQCAVSVVNVDRTCIAILDACEKYPQSHLDSKLNS
jgi:adenosine kinase